eukprot:gene1720-1242_t
MLQSVDLYIRTRKRFDSTSPLSYSIQLHTILSDESLLTEFADLCKEYPEVEDGINDLQSLMESFGEAKFCFTTNSGNVFVSVACLTPLQLESTHRVFGNFSCGNCRNSWTSAASWTNKWQKCKRSVVYNHMTRKDAKSVLSSVAFAYQSGIMLYPIEESSLPEDQSEI